MIDLRLSPKHAVFRKPHQSLQRHLEVPLDMVILFKECMHLQRLTRRPIELRTFELMWIRKELVNAC